VVSVNRTPLDHPNIFAWENTSTRRTRTYFPELRPEPWLGSYHKTVIVPATLSVAAFDSGSRFIAHSQSRLFISNYVDFSRQEMIDSWNDNKSYPYWNMQGGKGHFAAVNVTRKDIFLRIHMDWEKLNE
jgi:hypothetical protein